jgi:K+/H+ antiporter YhaU regulatory subunit KhtT
MIGLEFTLDRLKRIQRNFWLGGGLQVVLKPTAERLSDLLSAGTADSYYVSKGSWPAGKTLGAIDLRNRTGATVIAVVRGEEGFTSPGAEFAVEAGDTLVLVATHKDMESAFRFLGADQGGGEGGG